MDGAPSLVPTKELTFEPAESSDLTLYTSDGHALRIHSEVIRRGCSVWEDMLTSLPCGTAPVPVEETWEQLRPLILYLYSGGPRETPSQQQAIGWAKSFAGPGILDEMCFGTMHKFLEVARKYGCASLLQVCESYLCSDNVKLTTNMKSDHNVIRLLVLAYEHSLPEFMTKCTLHLHSHLRQLSFSLHGKGWKTTSKTLALLPREVLAGFTTDLLRAAGRTQAELQHARKHLSVAYESPV